MFLIIFIFINFHSLFAQFDANGNQLKKISFGLSKNWTGYEYVSYVFYEAEVRDLGFFDLFNSKTKRFEPVSFKNIKTLDESYGIAYAIPAPTIDNDFVSKLDEPWGLYIKHGKELHNINKNTNDFIFYIEKKEDNLFATIDTPKNFLNLNKENIKYAIQGKGLIYNKKNILPKYNPEMEFSDNLSNVDYASDGPVSLNIDVFSALALINKKIVFIKNINLVNLYVFTQLLKELGAKHAILLNKGNANTGVYFNKSINGYNYTGPIIITVRK